MKTETLLQEASAIAELMYGVADEVESNDADEKWRTVTKVKNTANDAYFYVALVVGAGKAQTNEYDCTSAKKYLNALKSMYLFAVKQDLVEIDPSLVVRIDRLVENIDAEQELSQRATLRKNEDDLKPWLEKLRIWQKISKD